MTQEPGRRVAIHITDDLDQLLAIVPDSVRAALHRQEGLETLIEVVLDLGRKPEARFPSTFVYLSEDEVGPDKIQFVVDRIGAFGKDNRAGIERTLHRISAIRNRAGAIVGLTCRVGRAVFGTINVIREAQRSSAKIIYTQTSLCYGPHPASPIHTDAPLDPHGSYAVSKTAGERYIADSGVDYVSLRLANIYGPRNLSGPIPTFYQRLAAGKPCTVVDSRRDFVFVDDLVSVAMKALTKGRGVYHVSTGSDVAISQLYWAVAHAMGTEVTSPEITPRGPDDVATLLLDPAETYAEFGWSARTPLEMGIRRAVDWYRAHGVAETWSHLKPPEEKG